MVTRSIIEQGLQGTLIDIECHMSNGLPAIVIIGFTNKAIDEAKERLRGAFTNANLQLPRKRIIINLAPGDIPKDGTSFDLAMACAILITSQQGQPLAADRSIFIGELGLDGTVRPVRGIIGKLLAARDKGITDFYIPTQNIEQARLVPNITLHSTRHLHDLYLHLSSTTPLPSVVTTDRVEHISNSRRYSQDFQDVIGQKRAKRAMEIAAAGGHNILLNGAPGTGKSMLARALPSILPELSHEEILEATHLHSLANRNFDQIITERPFRAPHHTASDTAILGGGQNPRPGEISLSHYGVLFFDELPEFNRTALEALRQPLEDRTITIARARESVTYPADFLLVATANPCPCGYYGSSKPCQCLPHQIIRYQRKLSGPILDRIDLYIEVDEVEHSRLLKDQQAEEDSETIKKRVRLARQAQKVRFGNSQKLNSSMSNRDIKQLAQISNPAQQLLNQAAGRLGISARAYMRTLKVGRTIADIEGSKIVEPYHIGEALQYRRIMHETKIL